MPIERVGFTHRYATWYVWVELERGKTPLPSGEGPALNEAAANLVKHIRGREPVGPTAPVTEPKAQPCKDCGGCGMIHYRARGGSITGSGFCPCRGR
jgi:hypothetical protein